MNIGKKITEQILIAAGFEILGGMPTHDKKFATLYGSPPFPPLVKNDSHYVIYEVEGEFRHYFEKANYNNVETVLDLADHHSKYSKQELFKLK
jgi:DNA-dependent RNA polymerase auxiliary subunit epsilon